MMDEVQSWWEIPAIAHFCYVFRSAFNLFYIEIGELEAAILNMQDPEMCISLEQLITRLLQGCYEENEVTSYNWEEKLHELFSENCEDAENPLQNNAFDFLPPRSKVQALLKLCEYRLDADGALETIKDIPPEDMQAKCIGKDGQNNLYWYFCDERLYKEDPSVPAKKISEQQSVKGKNTKDSIAKKATRGRKPKSDSSNQSWSIVCHSLSDWETLLKKFSKSKHKQEKELAQEIKEKYLPILTEVVAEKDQLLRKRFLELAPKRVSQRLSKVQAQKKLEEQMIAEANEKRQREMEEERMKKEAEKKKQEKEARKKRAEAREKIIQDRLLRAQQRDLMRGADVDEYNSDDKRTNRRSRNARKQTSGDDENETSSEEASDENDDEDEEEEDDASQSESENEQSAEGHSRNSDSEISDGDVKSKNLAPIKKVYASNGSSVSSNLADKNSFGRPTVIHNSYSVSNWNMQGDSKGQKIHIVRYAECYDGSPSNKRLKPNETSYGIGPVTSSSSNDARSSYYSESHAYHPLLHRNLNSCSKATSTPQVIRIDFIKPPKPQASR